MTRDEARIKYKLQFERDISIALKVVRSFEARTCENCNYFTGKVCYLHEGWNEDVGVVHPIMEKDDCCNKWEDKNKEN